MMEGNYEKKLIFILLGIIIFFYFIFLYIDLFKYQFYYISNMLKFTSIMLCFIISLLNKKNAFNFTNLKLLEIGMFLTVIADFILLVIDKYYEVGILIFSIVQIIYSVRYDMENKEKIIRNFMVIFLVLLIILKLMNLYFLRIRFLYAIVLFYGIALLTSLIKGIKAYIYNLYPRINGLMVALGMILFLLCDINVALYNVLKYADKVDGIAYRICQVSMWLYYLPSQVLLSLSGYKFKEIGREQSE